MNVDVDYFDVLVVDKNAAGPLYSNNPECWDEKAPARAFDSSSLCSFPSNGIRLFLFDK